MVWVTRPFMTNQSHEALKPYLRLGQQEDGDDPEQRSAQIPRRYHQQAPQSVESEDVAIIEHQVDDAEAQQQQHTPCETQREVLSLLSLIVPHDEEAETEQQCEDAVHLAGQNHCEDIEELAVDWQSPAHVTGRAEIEMFNCVVKNDADHGDASQGVSHLDAAVLESFGLVHLGRNDSQIYINMC